jgi:uncharacterized membrane protein YkoI
MKRVPILAVVIAAGLLLSFGSAVAKDEGLPADRVIAAIQTAIAAHPGHITEVDVEREGGRLIVEIEILSTDGKKTTLKVDPETNAVMR